MDIQKLIDDFPNEILTIEDFIEHNNYETDKVQLNRFINCINDNLWIYIERDLLEWMGYKDSAIANKKQFIRQILTNNFEEGKDYKIFGNIEFKSKYFSNDSLFDTIERNPNIRWHMLTKHILISPDAFIRVCSMIKNTKASNFFMKLKTLMELYERYKDLFQNRKLQNQSDDENEETETETETETKTNINRKIGEKRKILFVEDRKRIKRMKRLYKHYENMEKNEYIYIATSKDYAKKNIFKIGRASYIKKQFFIHNSNTIDEDEMEVIYHIRCYDAKTIEQGLRRILRFCHIKKEKGMYLLHFTHLKDVVEAYCLRMNEIAEHSNWLNDNKMDIYLSEEPIPFTKLKYMK
jgi:hypothetical protein